LEVMRVIFNFSWCCCCLCYNWWNSQWQNW